MRPCQINTGILQMIDKVKSNNDLKYEQLEYYKRRIIQEKNRLNDYIYMSPNVVQDQIQNELISQLDNQCVIKGLIKNEWIVLLCKDRETDETLCMTSIFIK